MIKIILFVFLASVTTRPCDNDDTLQSLFETADAVVVVSVLEVKPLKGPVEFWSGPVSVSQEVKYEIVKTIKGNIAQQEITVEHLLVKGSRTADKKMPQLSSEMFKHGNSIILFTKVEHDHDGRISYVALGGRCGVIRARSKIIQKLEKMSAND